MRRIVHLTSLALVFLGVLGTGCRRFREGQPTLFEKEGRWRRIRAGKSSRFRVDLKAGQFIRVLVEQRDIDLSVSASLADGTSLPAFSGGEFGYEAIDLMTNRAGACWITVSAPVDDSWEGTFRAWIAESRLERPTDILRLQAHRRLAAAFAETDSSSDSTERRITAAREAISMWREGGDLLRQAQALHNLGQLLQRRGKYLQSQTAYLDSLQIFERLGDPYGRLDAGQSLASIGSYFGEKRASLETLQRRLDSWRKLEERRGEAELLGSIAGYYSESRDWAHAIVSSKQSLRIWRELGNSYGMTDALETLARFYTSSKNPEKAVEYGRQALDLNRRLGDTRAIASSLYAVGISLAAEKRYSEAVRSLTESANLRHIQGDKSGEIGVREALCAATREKGDWELALRQCETAMEVEDALARSFSNPVQNARFRQSTNAHNAYVSTLASLGTRQSRSDYELRAFLTADWDRTRYLRPSFHGPPRLEQLTPLIDDDSVLLEYWIDPQLSQGVVWILTRSGFSSVPVPEFEKIFRLSRRVFRQLTSRDDSQKAPATTDDVKELGRILLGPVRRQIGNKRLLVVSDESFAFLPLGLLADPASDGKVTLLSSHEIVYLPSATALIEIRSRKLGLPGPTKLLAVVSDPVFSREDPRFQTIPPADSTQFMPERLQAVTRSFGWYRDGNAYVPRLAFAAREAQSVAREVPQSMVTEYTGFRANRTLALAELGKYRIIHIITHGLVDTASPDLSGLILALFDERGSPLPGFLDLESVYTLSVPADLVTLSACQTALGQSLDTQGVIGLTSAFFHAGTHRVVSSSWRVDDQSTAELMTRFYENLFRHKLGPGEALRQAQLSLAQVGRWQSPYYWGGFRLYGDWRPLGEPTN